MSNLMMQNTSINVMSSTLNDVKFFLSLITKMELKVFV